MRTLCNVALVVGLLLWCGSVSAQPIQLVIAPASQSAAVGATVEIALVVSGLGDFVPPSLSTFDLDVAFDPAILSFQNAVFGDQLGPLDPSKGTITQVLPGLMNVNLFELSGKDPGDLDADQPGSFTLVTLTFTALIPGTSTLDLIVNTLGDAVGNALEADASDGSVTVFAPTVVHCSSGDVSCLITAIRMANATNEDTTIVLEDGAYTVTAVDNRNEFGSNGLPSITSRITIVGADPKTTLINRAANAPSFRLFHVASTGSLSLERLTIRGGVADGFGGGIFNSNSGTVHVTNCTISENTAVAGGGLNNFGTMIITSSTISDNSLNVPGGSGGGILTTGTLHIEGSTISGNSGDAGGGINNDARFGSGTLTIAESTFSGNTAVAGGGVENIQGTATITNSTFSGNTATDVGGGLANSGGGIVTINSSTITRNNAPADRASGAGFFNFDENTVNISNTIIAAQNTGNDCQGTFKSLGFNLIGNNQGCTGFDAPEDQVGTPVQPIDARFGPLADNGGRTATHALLSGSPAIDRGNPATPGSGQNTCESADQRGFERPLDGDGDGTAVCDIGAVEFSASSSLLDCSTATASVDFPRLGNRHRYPVDIQGVMAPDGGSVVLAINSIFQDEPVINPTGKTCPDGKVVGTAVAKVRNERLLAGDGRVYHIGFTATNGAGASCTGEVQVCVPVKEGEGCGDQGPLFDSTECP